MASPEVLDFSTLLPAIAGDNPAGEDLRADSSPSSPYYAVKDARSGARAAERQMVTEGDESASAPDWRPVLRNAQEALANKTKDLEIVAYLTEALVRLHGFAGLRDGFRLARELVEQHWDYLYPLPDEEGLVTRVAPLTGLNGDDAEGTLINPINRVPLTEGSSCGPFAYYHYQQAGALAQLADESAREKRIEQGAISLPMFEKAVAETPAEFFRNLVEDLAQCQDEFAKLSLLLEEKCGSQAPPTSNIRAALTGCLDTVTAVARYKLATTQAAEESTDADGITTTSGGGGESLDALRNREDAFRTLLKVADFFRRTEPHTPVSFALEQAVRWGRMSLPELLTELISDENVRTAFFKQVGIRPPESHSSEYG